MKFLICPDSFKGTMTASQASKAISEGIAAVYPEAEKVLLPIGDGGEGTVKALASVLHDIHWVTCDSLDPLRRPIKASYAVMEDKTALIESAAASGLTLLDRSERDIMRADSYGTGILITDAFSRGIREFFICMGGTATCDGGIGALKAMKVMLPAAQRDELDITLLSDVDNPLCGPFGAAAVFGPQKGATADQIPIIDSRLKLLGARYGFPTDRKFGGAAGGLGAMLMACFGAKPVYGISKVLEILNFEKHLQGVDMVITGEGRADSTTLRGKAAKGVLDVAKKHGVPVALIAGSVADRNLLLKAGFEQVIRATPEDADHDLSPAHYLSMAARKLRVDRN